MAVEFYIGVMSGTSLDGVDAVLVALEEGQVSLKATQYQPYSDDLRADALALHEAAEDELHRAALLSTRLAHAYADTIHILLANAGLSSRAVRGIGCHGQTVRHAPGFGYSIQLNAPALLAELTGICVVADFRSRDIAAGGQGAPLVPAFHQAVFKDPERHRIILNVGGIANITNLNPHEPVRGFDCGPGNTLLDAWIYYHLGQAYDADGQWAAQGQLLPQLLARLLGHPFFRESPPKSCGREEFNLDWLRSHLVGHERPQDVQATLIALTAQATTSAITQACGTPDELYVCGGGAHNNTLMAALRAGLPDSRVDTTLALGIAADWVEAIAFAWLARRTLQGKSGNLPEVTGARGLRVLGAIYPA